MILVLHLPLSIVSHASLCQGNLHCFFLSFCAAGAKIALE